MGSSTTIEIEFVFTLLQRVGKREESNYRIEEIGKAGPDWDVILELVSKHGLKSVLRETISDTAVDPPEGVVRMLDEEYRENSLENLGNSRQLYELSELFESNNIAAIPYKGPVLAELAYGSIGDRSFGDLDFLVAKDDIKRACDVLERYGYERINFADIPVETLVDGSLFRWGKEFRFIKADGGLPVELRFGFIGGDHANSTIIADLWERRTPTSLAGGTVPALSSEDRALLLLAHGTKHGWRRLSWVYDIALILQQKVDWETVLARADQYRWRNAVLYGLAVTAELTSLPVPEEIRLELDSSRLCSWGADQTVNHLRSAASENLLFLEPITTALFLNDDLRGAFVEGIHEIMAPRKADHDWVQLPLGMYSLYYLVRPCRLAVNSFKRLTRA